MNVNWMIWLIVFLIQSVAGAQQPPSLIAITAPISGKTIEQIKDRAAAGDWIAQFDLVGGASTDNGYDIAAAGGFVYVAGDFRDTADFNPGTGVNSLRSAGKGNFRSPDGFVLKLDESGGYVSALQIGGASEDRIKDLVVEGGAIYVVGGFSGIVDFDPTASVQTRQTDSSPDTFFASYTTSGSLNWVQSISGTAGTTYDMRLGSGANSLYVTGDLNGTDDFDPSASVFNLTSVGMADAVVAKYAMFDGSLIWAKSFGGTGNDTAQFRGADFARRAGQLPRLTTAGGRLCDCR